MMIVWILTEMQKHLHSCWNSWTRTVWGIILFIYLFLNFFFFDGVCGWWDHKFVQLSLSDSSVLNICDLTQDCKVLFFRILICWMGYFNSLICWFSPPKFQKNKKLPLKHCDDEERRSEYHKHPFCLFADNWQELERSKGKKKNQ